MRWRLACFIPVKIETSHPPLRPIKMPRKTSINAGIVKSNGNGFKLKFTSSPLETATMMQKSVNMENAA